METYDVRLTFTEPLLGTVPLNKELYGDYIATKSPEGVDPSDEIETIEELTEKGTTGFHRALTGEPILYDYAVKGFLKDACGMLARSADTESKRLSAYKKVIDGLVFVFPRRIPIATDGGEIGFLERPLRAQTAKGERVALARSEMIMTGASLSFSLSILGQVHEKLLREWLDYGAFRGLGQWRNGSYGRFIYTLNKRA